MHSLAPLLLAVVGTVVYNVSQNAVPDRAAPAAVIALAYLVGFGCAAAAVVATGAPVAETARAAWKPAVCLGLGAATIEVGYLLAYRAGWSLSTFSLTANVTVAVVLLLIGLAAFGESLSPRQWVGIGVCVVGLGLVAAR